jgi:hypothetical protein
MDRFLTIATAFLLLSCSDAGLAPQDRDFNILFKYGVGARNELNTFENTYTKDLISDGTITVSLVLSANELHAIKTKLGESDFFSYPDTFRVDVRDTLSRAIEPHSTFCFRVKSGSAVKTLYWEDSVIPFYVDPRRKKLQEIVTFILDIISQKPEILQLPPVRGGYL